MCGRASVSLQACVRVKHLAACCAHHHTLIDCRRARIVCLLLRVCARDRVLNAVHCVLCDLDVCRAHRIICDATDGRVVLPLVEGNVELWGTGVLGPVHDPPWLAELVNDNIHALCARKCHKGIVPGIGAELAQERNCRMFVFVFVCE